MSTLTVQLNTVQGIDFQNSSGKDTLRKAINVLMGQLSGTGPVSSSINISVSNAQGTFFAPLLFPVIEPAAGVNSTIIVPEGTKSVVAAGGGANTLTLLKNAINGDNGADGTVSQYNYFTTKIADVGASEVLAVGDTLSIMGVQFVCVPGSVQTGYGTIPVGNQGLLGLALAINNHPALRSRVAMVDSQGAFSDMLLVWVGGTDDKAPALDYTDKLASDPGVDHAFTFTGWGSTPTAFAESSGGFLGCLVSKMPTSSSYVNESVGLTGLLPFYDADLAYRYPAQIGSPVFTKIEKIQL